MRIKITGHKVEVTESIKDYVQSKFSKLERHFEQINNVRVVLNIEKSNQTAEARLVLNGKEAFARSQHADMYAAIDTLIDKLDRQVIKHKEKMIRH
ncbi:MAG: ribosome hibernation-promoting factor, HPF/YfiA family [Parashewanella sp.]